ncbi:hypothetical protein XA68_15141 [Ophiocordyceps unilateralis]|uniref:Uncharacterized protein n=1 Tax=Ophiocordyceps unilateralis TaxID=268505 RepID=A0A2A9P946_OPHUN|nr:hypothetical protein XA68_15141 [Ophiocordyceps unilateralis]
MPLSRPLLHTGPTQICRGQHAHGPPRRETLFLGCTHKPGYEYVLLPVWDFSSHRSLMSKHECTLHDGLCLELDPSYLDDSMPRHTLRNRDRVRETPTNETWDEIYGLFPDRSHSNPFMYQRQ